MSRGNVGALLTSSAGALALVAASVLLSASSAGAVTCPTVDPATGQVTPGWANGVDWAGCNLTGADLYEAELANADLAGANLTDANLEEADVSGTDMTGAILTGADMQAANISSTILTNASLVDVHSGGITGPPAALPPDWMLDNGYLLGPYADLAYANFIDTDLTGAQLNNADLANANFAGTTLTNVVMTGADLDGAMSGSIVGTPTSLPTNWMLQDGYLVGPGANLSSADLIDATLAGLDMDGDNLSSSALTGANLIGANLTDANLTGVKLGSAVLTDATLTGVQASGISGTPTALPTDWNFLEGDLFGPGTDLAGADLQGFGLTGYDLDGADLSNTNLLDANLATASLTSANLANSMLESANLAGADFSDADLTLTDLTQANLTDANLTDANLTSTGIADATLAGVNLTGANLTGIGSYGNIGTPAELPAHWIYKDGMFIGPGAVLTNADFDGWNLDGADLSGAGLGDAQLVHTDLVGANLSDINLLSTNLSFADLYGANVTGANLGYTNFSFANVGHANLRGATVTGATFAKASWSDTTCPDGSNSNEYIDGCLSSRLYGFAGSIWPRPKSTWKHTVHSFVVSFRLTSAGKQLSQLVGSQLATAKEVRVVFSGTHIKSEVVTCRWVSKTAEFNCTVSIPRTVRTGKAYPYSITVEETQNSGFARAPADGKAANPAVIYFK